MGKPLTRRQQQVLDAIRQHIHLEGYAPTISELVDACGLNSKSTIHFHLTALAELGLIRWKPGKSRTIALMEVPA